MIEAITFGDEKYRHHVRLNLFTAKFFGKVNKVKSFSLNDIDQEFYAKNKLILDQPRGAGYWLWKPYIISKALDNLNDGDFLIYSDAGTAYIRGVKHLIRQMNRDHQDIMLCAFALPNKDWCKADCFEYLGVDPEVTKDLFQLEGTYMVIKKSKKGIEFVNEWLRECQDERVLTDLPDTCGKPCATTFVEHRHDQAVLTLLAYKFNIRPYKSFARNSDWILETLYKDYISNNGEIDQTKKIFYRYTPNEIVDLVLALRATEAYKESKYPQVLVNVRLREFTFRFYRKAICMIVESLWLLVNKEKKERKVLEALGYTMEHQKLKENR